MATNGVEPPHDDAERRLRAVVAHAEQLVEAARLEAARLVEEAQVRAQTLMDDANRLRGLAEHEAQEILVDAERIRAAARRESEALMAETQTTHDAAVSEARSMIDDSTRALRSEPRPRAGSLDAEQAQHIISQASETADRILRVARSEAEARSREMVDKARRKVEQAEADARSRLDVLQRQYRQKTRELQQEELDLRVRIQQLKMELSSLERGGQTSVPGPAAVETTREVFEPSPDSEDAGRPPRRASAVWEAVPRPVDEGVDDETLRALRSIRRRA